MFWNLTQASKNYGKHERDVRSAYTPVPAGYECEYEYEYEYEYECEYEYVHDKQLELRWTLRQCIFLDITGTSCHLTGEYLPDT